MANKAAVYPRQTMYWERGSWCRRVAWHHDLRCPLARQATGLHVVNKSSIKLIPGQYTVTHDLPIVATADPSLKRTAPDILPILGRKEPRPQCGYNSFWENPLWGPEDWISVRIGIAELPVWSLHRHGLDTLCMECIRGSLDIIHGH